MRIQKWPASLSLVRHGESAYNAKKNLEIPEMDEFKVLYEEEFKKMDAVAVYTGKFPSAKLKAMALRILPFVAPSYSDFDTELTDVGYSQAVTTGKNLPDILEVPDVIYFSPYKRTRRTLEGLKEGWPQLKRVKTYEDDRIREQEHGNRTVVGDARVYFVLHPEEALLYKFSTKYEYKHRDGESLLDVRSRVRSKLDAEIREHGGITRMGQLVEPQRSLWVTHHLVILATRSNLERWDRDRFIQADEKEKPVNCGVTIYRGKPAVADGGARDLGKLVLDKYNQKLY